MLQAEPEISHFELQFFHSLPNSNLQNAATPKIDVNISQGFQQVFRRTIPDISKAMLSPALSFMVRRYPSIRLPMRAASQE